jgi:hypothetical protein
MRDPLMSLVEIAEHFKLPLRRVQHLYYRRDDCPQPIAERSKHSGGTWTPLYSLSEFETYLQELGIIPKKIEDDEITLFEAAKLLKLSFTRTKELLRKDKKFPTPIGGTGKTFYRRMAKITFSRKAMLEYKTNRRKKRDLIKIAKVEPIALPGVLNADIMKFMATPTARRQRRSPTVGAQTTRIRTEGVVGKW